jgi:hypothetical protein
MAINPNTDFTTGAVLTAAQQNRFPRGVMVYDQRTTSDATITAEEVQITGTSFTAVANRYYKITYYEPNPLGGTGFFAFRIRQTNISGTILQTGFHTSGSGVELHACIVWVGTFGAGTVNVVATASMSAGTGQLSRSAGNVAFLLVEDIGPA